MVSIIVPVFQSEDTIEGCVRSILAQSYQDIEVILVNDGSTDGSGRICDTFAQQNSFVSVIHQENKGRIKARHVGVQHAKGEWIAFVDSDDQLLPHAIADLYERVDDDTDIILGNGNELPNERREVIPMDDFRHKAVRGDGTIGVPWGSLYRRAVITPYLFDLSRDVISGEDYIFWLRLVFSTERPVKVVYKNVYTKSTDRTSGYFKWTADYAQMLNKLRVGSIPKSQRDFYFDDILHDRIANLFDVSVSQSAKEWRHSQYYRDILRDTQLSLKQRLFLAIPSLRLRKLLGYYRTVNIPIEEQRYLPRSITGKTTDCGQ